MAKAKVVMFVNADRVENYASTALAAMILDRIEEKTGVKGVPVVMVESRNGSMPDFVVDVEFVRESVDDDPQIELVLQQLASAIENLFPQTVKVDEESRSMQLSVTSKIGVCRQIFIE